MGGGGTECAETSDGEATLGLGTGWSPGHKALKNSRPPRLPKDFFFFFSPKDFLRAKRWGWGRDHWQIGCHARAIQPVTHTHTQPSDPYLSSWWTNLAGVSARAEGGKKNVLELIPPRAPFPKAQTSEGVMDKGELEGGPLKSSWPGSHCAFQTVVVGGSEEKRDEAVTEQEKAAESGQHTQERPRGQKTCTSERDAKVPKP